MRAVVPAMVLLALMAGCNALTGPSPETAVTPAPVPEPATEPSSESEIAPGVGGTGVTDPERLARAHTDAIHNRSYRWIERTSLTRLESNTTETSRTALWVEHPRRHRYEFTTTLLSGNTSEYTEGDTRYRREFGDYNFVAEPSETASERYGAKPAMAIRRYFSTGNATVETVRVHGDHAYRVVGTTSALETADTVDSYRVAALVMPSGFVRSLSVDYTVSADGRHRRVQYRYRYVNVGTTRVEPPVWAQRRWPESVDTRSNDTAPTLSFSNTRFDYINEQTCIL